MLSLFLYLCFTNFTISKPETLHLNLKPMRLTCWACSYVCVSHILQHLSRKNASELISLLTLLRLWQWDCSYIWLYRRIKAGKFSMWIYTWDVCCSFCFEFESWFLILVSLLWFHRCLQTQEVLLRWMAEWSRFELNQIDSNRRDHETPFVQWLWCSIICFDPYRGLSHALDCRVFQDGLIYCLNRCNIVKGITHHY